VVSVTDHEVRLKIQEALEESEVGRDALVDSDVVLLQLLNFLGDAHADSVAPFKTYLVDDRGFCGGSFLWCDDTTAFKVELNEVDVDLINNQVRVFVLLDKHKVVIEANLAVLTERDCAVEVIAFFIDLDDGVPVFDRALVWLGWQVSCQRAQLNQAQLLNICIVLVKVNFDEAQLVILFIFENQNWFFAANLLDRSKAIALGNFEPVDLISDELKLVFILNIIDFVAFAQLALGLLLVVLLDVLEVFPHVHVVNLVIECCEQVPLSISEHWVWQFHGTSRVAFRGLKCCLEQVKRDNALIRLDQNREERWPSPLSQLHTVDCPGIVILLEEKQLVTEIPLRELITQRTLEDQHSSLGPYLQQVLVWASVFVLAIFSQDIRVDDLDEDWAELAVFVVVARVDHFVQVVQLDLKTKLGEVVLRLVGLQALEVVFVAPLAPVFFSLHSF
jgi:hypothetical protein